MEGYRNVENTEQLEQRIEAHRFLSLFDIINNCLSNAGHVSQLYSGQPGLLAVESNNPADTRN